MSGEQFVVLGLARVRSQWFREVSRWATSGAVPAEFVKCISAEELRARLASGRPVSAVLVDGGLPALDRDLVDVARSHGCAVIAVDDGHVHLDWSALGITAVLPEPLDAGALTTALAEHATPIDEPGGGLSSEAPDPAPDAWRAHLVAVTGAGGSGTSTVAMALAQGLALDARRGGRVLLADLALHADLAMLHDAGDVIPGLQELVEAHRSGSLTAEQVRETVFVVVDRGYDLLLGLRRHRDWPVLRPRAVDAALDSLRRAYKLVVADVEPDLEGEAECGSLDVEDRNALARAAVGAADVVVVTATPSVAGLHRLVTTLGEVLRHGVEPGRVLTVVNRAPRNPRQRAEFTGALGPLTAGLGEEARALATPIYLGERRNLDECLRAADPLPGSLVGPVSAAVDALLERSGRAAVRHPDPVAPGSLGSWADDGPEPHVSAR